MECPGPDVVATRWGVAPDDAINYATIPAVEARASSWARRRFDGAVPWVSPYPRRADDGGAFIGVLDRVHPPERPIERLLSLCCGHGHAERALARVRAVRSSDGVDISPAAIAHAAAVARQEGFDTLHYRVADLNQLTLEGTYDFVYAGGVHHLSNLEHVFAEVRHHLAPGAPFMMYEYIGAARCQYTRRQVEAINSCIRLLPERLRVRISAQRELGIPSSTDAYDRLARRLSCLENSEPMPLDVFPLTGCRRERGSMVETGTSGLRVTTPAERFHYGVKIPRKMDVPEAAGERETVLMVDAHVRGGEIGIGYVTDDGSTFLEEFVVKASDRRTWHLPFPTPNRCRWIVLRNQSANGQPSVVEVYGIRVGLTTPNPQTRATQSALADDPRTRRYFWTDFRPMTVEEWKSTDPSESIRSDEIVPQLRAVFPWVHVCYTRGSLLQFVLYDLAANFYGEADEVRHYLDMLFHIEDVVMAHDDVPENFAYVVAADSDLTQR
jgi:SAM-dependent methyltransferase